MRFHLGESRVSVRLSVAIGILTAALAVSAAVPAPAAAGGPRGVVRDVDDHHADPRYQTFYDQTVSWAVAHCPDYIADAGLLECATVRAPKDWSDPTKGELGVGISRPVGVGAKQRLLLSNPGGPGGSGIDFSLSVVEGFGLSDTHLPIGIDPRGLGSSSQLTCNAVAMHPDHYAAEGDSRSFDRASVMAAVSDVRRYNAACATDQAELLPYIDSVQTAFDVNLVRHLMGYRTADFYGVSYGTWLGSLLAKMFDSRFDRVVLDANTDFESGSFDQLFDYWPAGFQASFDRMFLPFIARHDSRYHLGTSVAEVNASYEQVRAAVAAGHFGPNATPDLLDGWLRSVQYSSGSYAVGAEVLAVLKADLEGDPSHRELIDFLFTMLDQPGDPNGVSVFTAVVCNDTGGEQNAARWYATHRKAAVDLPLAGPGQLVNTCAGWVDRTPAVTRRLLNRPLNGVLMVQTEADPATPYVGARSSFLRSRGTRQLVNVDDAGGHGAAMGVSRCAYTLTAAYLASGTPAAPMTWCQGEPLVISGDPIEVESTAYEFGHPASDRRPLPRVYGYRSRDLSEPMPDGGTANPPTRARALSLADGGAAVSDQEAVTVDARLDDRVRTVVEDARQRSPLPLR